VVFNSCNSDRVADGVVAAGVALRAIGMAWEIDDRMR
jgi:hypothetical protein